jgi:adenylate cyclase
VCEERIGWRKVRVQIDSALQHFLRVTIPFLRVPPPLLAPPQEIVVDFRDGTSAPRAPALPNKPSIAVLAFTNMSGDPEQEYFADGISEDIITALSKISQIFVIARNSSFTFKGKAVHAKEVSKSLGVRYILEGSIRKAGNRVRITSQLIDGVTGGHLWAECFDRDLTDIFAVQDEVTREIVSALATQLDKGRTTTRS